MLSHSVRMTALTLHTSPCQQANFATWLHLQRREAICGLARRPCLQADTGKRLPLQPCFLRRWGWLNVARLCNIEHSYNFVEGAMPD
jgi:hypothetical protein